MMILYLIGSIFAIFILCYEYSKLSADEQKTADIGTASCAPLLSWVFVVLYFYPRIKKEVNKYLKKR